MVRDAPVGLSILSGALDPDRINSPTGAQDQAHLLLKEVQAHLFSLDEDGDEMLLVDEELLSPLLLELSLPLFLWLLSPALP